MRKLGWLWVCGLVIGCGDGDVPADTGDTGDETQDTLDVADVGDAADGFADVDPDSVSEDTSETTPDVEDVADSASDVEDTGDTSVDVEDTGDTSGDVEDTGDTSGDVEDTGDTTPDPYEGLRDEALRAVLNAETELGHTPLGYTRGRDAMYAVGGIDDINGRIECIYTGRTVDATGSRTPNRNCKKADGTPIQCNFNTEHTWARYYLRQALTEGSSAYNAAEGDIHHLRPSDDDVNNWRWHFDFGETSCPDGGACKVTEESVLGQREGVTGYANCPTGNLSLDHVCVMEVRPLRRGDVARGMFYMSVRYDMAMDDEMEAALRVWNQTDPPDQSERLRNDGVESAQGNRNPFIDRPDLVDRISDF